jgi:hypothetical protein
MPSKLAPTLALAATVATMLALAAPALAAKDTYAGKVKGTQSGRIALDVRINRGGFVTKITQIRVVSVPATCEISGPIPGVNVNLSGKVPIDQQTAKWSASYTQETYGNQSTAKGTLFGRTMKGKFQISQHFPPFETYPEENCDTGRLKFKASLDNPDETLPPAPRLRY